MKTLLLFPAIWFVLTLFFCWYMDRGLNKEGKEQERIAISAMFMPICLALAILYFLM